VAQQCAAATRPRWASIIIPATYLEAPHFSPAWPIRSTQCWDRRRDRAVRGWACFDPRVALAIGIWSEWCRDRRLAGM